MRSHRKTSTTSLALPNRLKIKSLILWNLRGNLAEWAFDRFRVRKRWIINRAWKMVERKEDKECLIIAGGPGFTRELAEALADNRRGLEIMAVNYYHTSLYSGILVPNCYVLSDPKTFKEDGEIGRKLRLYLRSHDISVFTPYGAEWVEESLDTVVFNDSENIYSSNIDPRKPRGYTSNTAFKGIAIALALGYKKIYVAGLDHDYPRRISVTRDLKLTLDDTHHYDNTKKKPELYPYFECMAHALHCYALNFWHLRKLSSPKIVNVTNDSMIDVFERVSIEDFIGYLKDGVRLPEQEG